jgi:creatinine amidohydrolase
MKLAELTYEEAAHAAKSGAIALVPVGATEAHGPHLPLATDVIISEELARRAASTLAGNGRSCVIAPSLAYSVTEYAAPFGGTISVKPATAIALVADVCAGLQRQGFARVCLVNSHLEPAHVATLRDACARVLSDGGKPVAFPDNTEKRWARTLTEEFKRGACHAGSYETSLVMVARPELVRDTRASLPEKPIDLAKLMRAGVADFVAAGAERAYFGNPAAATVEEGNAIYQLLVQMIVTTIDEIWKI